MSYLHTNEHCYSIDIGTKDFCISSPTDLRENQSKPLMENKHSGRYTGIKVLHNFLSCRTFAIELTEKCNLDCIYCAYGDFYYEKKLTRNQDISFEIIKSFFDDYTDIYKKNTGAELKDLNIAFYGGEPLLAFTTIEKTVDYFKEKRINCHYSMTTNAVYLDKYLKYLVKHNFKILISLDGYRFADSLRLNHAGQESFPKVYENICEVKNKYPVFYKNKISFNAVYNSRANYRLFVNFFIKNLNKVPQFAEIFTEGITNQAGDLFKKYHTSIYLDFLSNMDNRNPQIGLENPDMRAINDFIFSNKKSIVRHYDELLFDKIQPTQPTGTCPPFSLKLFITSSGLILPCERVGYKNVLGKIENSKINIDFQKIADLYNDKYDRIEKQCNQCYSSERCPTCIFHVTEEDNVFNCNKYCSLDQYNSSLTAKIKLLEKNHNSYISLLKRSKFLY